ncbi:MAG: CHAT domain-containing protein [Blastocatellia bacterium]|nr:CHAT domain-containing protein [Blastocatellia bacterium]
MKKTSDFHRLPEMNPQPHHRSKSAGLLLVGILFFSIGTLWGQTPESIETQVQTLLACKNQAERDAYFKQEKDRLSPKVCEALIHRCETIRREGSLADALTVAETALALALELNDRSWIATARTQCGHIYLSQGEFDTALRLYEQTLLPGEPPLSEGRAWLNMANVHYYRGDYDLALETYRKALGIFETISSQAGISRTLNNIGSILQLQGKYAAAFSTLQKSLAIKEKMNDLAGQANTFNNIGILYYDHGNFEMALEFHQKSFRIREELKDISSMAQSLNNMGNAYRRMEQFKEARECHERSLELKRKIGERLSMAGSYANLGNVLGAQGKLEEALVFFEKANEINRELKVRPSLSLLNNMASTYRHLGKYEQVIALGMESARLAEQTTQPDLYWMAITEAGLGHYEMGNLKAARDCFEQAIAAVEKMRTLTLGDELEKQRFFEPRLDPYQAMVAVCLQEGNQLEALKWAEQAKARILVEVIQGERKRLSAHLTLEEQQQEQKLSRQMTQLNRELMFNQGGNLPDAKRKTETEARLSRLGANFRALQNQLAANHSEVRLAQGTFPAITPDTLRELGYGSDTALLEFVVVPDYLYLFCLTRPASQPGKGKQAEWRIRSVVIPGSVRELGGKVDQLQTKLASRSLGFKPLTQELYRQLFGQIEAELKGKTKLVIIPDGPLWNLPFQALQNQAGQYLVENYEISAAHSLALLLEMTRQPARTAGSPRFDCVALGNPATQTTNILPPQPAGGLASQAAAQKLIEQIQSLYGPERCLTLTGGNATEDKLKQAASETRLLHLSTHGVWNHGNPLFSYLVLAPGLTENEDGLLETRELLELKLRADVVILSACETARGRLGNGEGLIGMTWAILLAGTPQTIVSHWKVEAVATSALMTTLHQTLRVPATTPTQPLPAAAGLRAAVLQSLRSGKFSHPFYWAGFSVIGENPPRNRAGN